MSAARSGKRAPDGMGAVDEILPPGACRDSVLGGRSALSLVRVEGAGSVLTTAHRNRRPCPAHCSPHASTVALSTLPAAITSNGVRRAGWHAKERKMPAIRPSTDSDSVRG